MKSKRIYEFEDDEVFAVIRCGDTSIESQGSPRAKRMMLVAHMYAVLKNKHATADELLEDLSAVIKIVNSKEALEAKYEL